MAWMTASEALAALGVKPQTLYASVSRGRIAAKPDPKDPRRSLYSASDVKKLAARARGAPRSQTVAAQSLAWGEPVLTTALSTVEQGRLLYRGADAATLAQTAGLEEVAALLWGAEAPVALRNDGAAIAGATGRARLFAALAARVVQDPPSLGRSAALLRRDAAEVAGVVLLAAAGPGQGKAHERLAHAWGSPPDPVRRALVLLADHELNASTFAARVAVSTGASLAAGVLAGLAALTGPLHGAAGLALLALKADADRSGPEQAVASWLAQGRALPAFGHPLYPEIDPRGVAMLEGVEIGADWTALAQAAAERSGEAPNVDFALAALTDRFSWPAEAPFVLFAVARTVGWLAHGIEQAGSGGLIRPRARYVGPRL
ncbi:MAG: citrate synthase family protein [Proteobacteria bacterium]|nr:citrate synthase family protein [Pseudomonadota bacterium]